jgi:hypothetical protein
MQDLSVKLTADIIYVTGTVNGVAATFTKIGADIWTTTVTVSEDLSYEIYILAYDELGRMTEYAVTEYYGFSTITNRGVGTFYNYTDLNRVGRSVKYLADWFNLYRYTTDLDIKTDWLENDIPTLSIMETYLANVQTLIDIFCVMQTTPELPGSIKFLNYSGANDIEKVLFDLKFLLENMIASFNYANEIYSGE